MTEIDEGIYDIVPDEDRSAEPRRESAYPLEKAMPLPCPKCGYELRGTKMQNCPECGKAVSYETLKREAKRQKMSVWKEVYREPTLWIVGGLAAGLLIKGNAFGLAGVIFFLALCGFFVVSGWTVFLLCSWLWIGFDQRVHTTAVQLAACYVGYLGLYEVFSLMRIPVIPGLMALGCLIMLLQRILEIDVYDAVLISFFVGVAKWLLVIYVLARIFGL